MGIIELEGMRFYAYHGCLTSEMEIGNEFIVDVSIETDCSAAGKSDNLEDALNYQAVYDIVKREMEVRANLLEHLSQRILDALWESFTQIERIKIKVTKMKPPVGGNVAKASITLIREK